MNTSQTRGAFLLRLSWCALLGWQLAWHALLPPPHGSSNWILAMVAVVPLLALTRGVMKLSHRSLVLGMLVVMLYFIVGVMEAWSNPAQRFSAWMQIVLSCGYFAGLIWFRRPVRARAG